MDNWTAGYVKDIEYTFGYYHELNPNRLKLAFLNAGLVFPECENICELGYGQGLSINIHAAATNKNYYGTDFNASQASYAKNLANSNKSKINLKDDSFKEFLEDENLPEFDFIALHGIWSWINDQNRMVIVDFLKRKLKIGGVLYISYNTMPGWSSFAPIRQLLTEHASVMGSRGEGITSRVNNSINHVKNLNKVNPNLLNINANLEEKFKNLDNQSIEYLAHEYFNKDWCPMYFSSVAELLELAKLDFACSANYLDSVDAINLTEEQQLFLNNIADVKFRESNRDFIVNQQFRKDYWIKGKRKLNNLEQINVLRMQKIILVVNKDDVVLKVNGVLGEATMSEQIYKPILEVLGNNRPISISQIEEELRNKNIDIKKINQAIMILSGMGYVALVQEEEEIKQSKNNTDLLNSLLMKEAQASDSVTNLASPVTGGGIKINRFHQLFLLAYKNGKENPEEWAKYVWEILKIQGQKIIKDGKAIEAVEDNIAELIEQANIFHAKKLHIMKSLMII